MVPSQSTHKVRGVNNPKKDEEGVELGGGRRGNPRGTPRRPLVLPLVLTSPLSHQPLLLEEADSIFWETLVL
jgi:hypothetical protein